MVFDKKLLTLAQCRKARATIYALRRNWMPVLDVHPHHMLGAWLFHDARKSFTHYQRIAARYNPLLREHLGWVYDLLTEKMTEVLGSKPVYDERLALPTFKVFLPSPRSAQALGHVHFDSPHPALFKNLKWKVPAHPEKEFFTFVMPLSMPKAGAGLDVWDLDFKTYDKLSPVQKAFELSAAYRMHPYKLGVLTLQRGYVFHRASGTNRFTHPQDRVTMQGHVIKQKGRWILYL